MPNTMKVTTRPANLSATQKRRMHSPDKVREVLVDGVVVGHYARNKHGVVIGHLDPQAVAQTTENPFVAARQSHSAFPVVRGTGRTTKDLVADIAAGRVGEVSRYYSALSRSHEYEREGVWVKGTTVFLLRAGSWRTFADRVAQEEADTMTVTTPAAA